MAVARAAWIVLLACLAGIGGCSSATNPASPPTGPAPGIMNAAVDGLPWSAGGITGSPAAASYTPGGADTTLLLVGHRFNSDGSGSFVRIFARSFAGTGSYALSLETSATSGAQAIFASYTVASDTTSFATDVSHTGTLNMTLFDLLNRDIKGTFTFTGYHAASTTTTAVTSGYFDVSF